MKNRAVLSAVICVGAMLAPMAASALSITFKSGADTITIVDGGAGDLDSDVNSIAVQGHVLGTADLKLTATFATDNSGESILDLIVGRSSSGANALEINVSHAGFGGGAQAPGSSFLNLTANASDLSPGGSIAVEGFYDNTNTEFAGVSFGSGNILTDLPGGGIDINGGAVLSNPFSMSIFTTIAANTTTQFDATATATVPVPAAGLLLLAGLGGLGAMKRRKS